MGNDPILPVSQTRVLNLYTTVTPKLSISSLNKIFMSNIGFCSTAASEVFLLFDLFTFS